MERNDQIKALRKEGKSLLEIAQRFGITRERVRQIVMDITYGKVYTEKRKAWVKKHRNKVRLEVLRHYSNGSPRCACCKEKQVVFLCLDHINGGGRQHRKTLKQPTIYLELRKLNYPTGFQVLCYNCNNAKYTQGKCPHKLTKSVE